MPKTEEAKDDFFDQVMGMADKIGLTGKDKQRYVHEHMTRSGYDMVPSYVKSSEGGDDDDSDFFGNRTRKPKESGNGNGGNDKGSGGWF